MFYRDTPGHVDDDNAKTGNKEALKLGANLLDVSKPVHMIAPIFHDVFQMECYLLNQVSLDLKFCRSKPNFYLMSDAINQDYRIQIDEMVLHICKVQVNPAVIYA